MARDFRAYQDPGIFVEEVENVAQGGVATIQPTLVALVGESSGFTTQTERLTLPGTFPADGDSAFKTLVKQGIDVTSIRVVREDTQSVALASTRIGTGAGPGTISSGDLNILVVEDGDQAGLTTPFDIWIDDERLTVTARVVTTAPEYDYTVTRGVGGTTAASHVVDSIVRANDEGDFDLRVVEQTIPGPSTTIEIARTDSSSVTDGLLTLLVSYEYTDPNYYRTYSFDSPEDVAAFYGQAVVGGSVASPISLAARLLFKNGAIQVVTVAVEDPDSFDSWVEAIDKLADEVGVNVVVPVIGDLTLGSQVQDYVFQHVKDLSASSMLRRGFVGRNDASASDLRTQAIDWSSTRMTLVGPSAFNYIDPSSGNELVVGGEYAAAAAAGSFAARPPQEPLTHKRIFGFDSIPSQASDAVVKAQQRDGVTMFWNRRDETIIVKHGLTTKTSREDPTFGTIFTQELNIQAAQDRMHELIEDSLDSSGLIGSIMTSTTPERVVGIVEGALFKCKDTTLINDYADLRVKLDSPTAITVSFQYKPTLPLNFIQVFFTMNTDSGEIQFQDAGVEAA